MDPGDLRVNEHLGNEKGYSRDTKSNFNYHRNICEDKTTTNNHPGLRPSPGTNRSFSEQRFLNSVSPSTSSPSTTSLVPDR